MENSVSPNVPALIYNGEVIHEREQMLSLTDMWKAAGSPDLKRPADWKKDSANVSFIEHVAEFSNAPVEGIWKGTRGNNGTTFAHWQIGLAYAKYLSPEFHMWCNNVVRSHMEGRKSGLTIPDDLREQFDRMFGISKMLSHKMAESEKAIAEIRGAIPAIVNQSIESALVSDARRAALHVVSVRNLLDEAKAIQKARRGLNRSIGNALRDRAAADTQGGKAYRCPHTGVWLFNRAFADAFMREVGTGMVAAHNDRQRGQGVLKLVPKKSAPAKSSPPPL